MCGTMKCAKEGLLIKNSDAIEKINKVDTVLFDKTGTITTIQSDGKDELKKDASLVIKYLKKKKIKVIMITGEKRSMHLILLVKLELVM